jgi:hypothetical protein
MAPRTKAAPKRAAGRPRKTRSDAGIPRGARKKTAAAKRVGGRRIQASRRLPKNDLLLHEIRAIVRAELRAVLSEIRPPAKRTARQVGNGKSAGRPRQQRAETEQPQMEQAIGG